MVHSDLSLEAGVGVFLLRQGHDACVEHEEVQSGLGGQEVCGELLDAREGVQVQFLHDDVLGVGCVLTEALVGDLAVNSALAGLHRAGAQNNTSSGVRKSLGHFQTNAAVATCDDGSLAVEVLAFAKVLDDLRETTRKT